MNANDVLIDILEDNRRRLLRLFESVGDECVFWKPEAEANSIAVTVWHMARIFDVFLTLQAKGDIPEEECWFRHGWALLTGYDPRGLGLNEWGMLTGYTQKEVAAIPHLTREQILGYLNDVYDTVNEYLRNTPIEKLLLPGSGFEGKYSQYQCIQMPLLDNVRHLGEIFAIKARWERSIKEG
jgi:DinB superfamily